MADFISGINKVGPSYPVKPVKPVQPAQKDRETGERKQRRGPDADETHDSDKPTIDEHV